MTPEGQESTDLAQRKLLQDAGHVPCLNPACSYMHAPQQLGDTCPSCQTTPDEEYEYFDPTQTFHAGGQTRAGLTLKKQGDIGEEVVQQLGQLPGYGPITWWSDRYNSPLDGATDEWGIEVKTANTDNTNWQFAPRPAESETKMAMAKNMGKKGILGVLVVLDYRRSVADIYAKEFPLAGWQTQSGALRQGLGFFRASVRKTNDGRTLQPTVPRFLEEIPFQNPFMTPTEPTPTYMPF